MTRIFSTLAIALLVALGVTFVVGLVSMQTTARDVKAEVFLMHFTLGLFTALGALLVHCIIFVYFLGTGRWVKEVTLAYDMPDEPLHKTTRELKRAVFPPALFAMLITITTAAAGAARQVDLWPWQVHFSAAIICILVNLWAFRMEFKCLRENSRVLEEVLLEVDRIRAERGLPSNADALVEEKH